MEAAFAFAAWWSVILAMIGVAALVGVKVRPGWVAAAIVLQLIYFASNVFGGQLLSLESYFGDLNWNWDGKIVATLTTLLVFAVLAVTTRAVSFQSAGFVFRQKQGSVVPALIAILSLTLLVIGLEIAVNDGREIDSERLLFQATMPRPRRRAFLSRHIVGGNGRCGTDQWRQHSWRAHHACRVF